MAKSRRIIRKIKHGDNAFDDQLWPVFFALLILGGFLEGVTINFVPWFGPIYFNKLVYMIMIPIFIALSMVVISQIKSRTMRRGLQFAIILSLCIHIGFFIFANGHTVIRFVQDILVADVSKAREVKTVPDYQEFQINPEAFEKPDFLKPVETKTEEPELEKVEKKQPEPEPDEPKEKPPEPKKPEPEKPKPEPIKKKTPEQAVPKASPTRSMRSRQVVKVNVPKLPTKVETPKPATQPKQQPSQHQAKSTPTPTKSDPTEAKVRQKPVETEAVAQTQPKAVELNRRKTEPEKVTTNQPAKSTPRRTPTPTPQPIVKTEVTPVQSSQSQKVASKSPTAKQAVAQKRDSTSPTTAKQAPKEPLPERPTQVAQVSATRQQQTEKAPTLNSSQKPTVSRATRSPIVPNINTLAQPNATNQAANPTTEPKVAARTVPKVNRQTNQPPTLSRAPSPTNVPTPARSAAVVAQASPTKATSASRPTPNPTAAPSVSKAIARANRPSLTFSKPIATPTANQTPSANPTQSTAKAITTSTTRTAHTGPTIPNKASVSAPQAPSPSPKATSVAAATTSRATTATSAPKTSAQTSNNVARSSARSVKAPSTTAITVNSSPAPTTNATKAAGAVAKASSNTRVRKAASAQSTAQSASPVAMAAPSANPSQRAATASATRRTSSAVPTLQPNAAPGQSPSRAVTSAKIAASPSAIASPSRAVSTRATNNPSAAPTRTSLTKADQGTSTAGVGQAPNMDRGVPAANRTALAASASAQRNEATQKAQPGPAISPSAPAAISRSRAGANIPKAVVTATQVENANMAAAQTPTDAVASASAAVKKSDASAKESNITAAKGTTEVDLGPNRIVSSEEQKNLRGRPAGGGQPVLNTTTQATPLARSNSGGSPAVAINTNVKAVQAEAPSATGGGQPAATEIAAANSSATRAESGGGLPEEGGPKDEDDEDEENKDKAGGAVAAKAIGRATSSEQTPGAPADGGGQPSPARSASTRSLVANIHVAAPAASAPAASGDGQPAGAPAAAATSIARTDASGGAPTEGGPSNASESGAADPGSGAPSVAKAIGRAATSDAGGPPAAGGGTGSPTRSATSRLIAASTQAVVLVRAATGDLSGSAGGPATARGTELARADTASTTGGPAGGETSEPAMSQSANIAGAPGMGRRSDSTGDAGGPQVSASASSGSPGRRSSRTGIQMGALAAIDVPAASPGAPTADPNIAALMGGGSNTGVARQASGGLNVELALAPAGPGGLGSEFAANAGISSRQAHADSEVVHSDTARFLQRTAGGSVAVNASASLAKEGFAGRDLGTRPTGGGANGAPPPKTNETIELGLQFLSRQQLIDGSWSLRELRGKPESEKTPILHTNTAATGMSLLAFLGAGYHHKDHKYQEVVAGGINSLTSHQKENGDLYENLDDFSTGSVRFYSHGIATIALCEAYGMTRDPDLREPAQKAIDYIVKTQHKTRGGWRYSPIEAQRESDTSVTGWMMMALKSGELSGLEVPRETFDKIEKWLDASQASKSERHLYRYNPHAQDTKLQRHGRKPNLTMTSVGLLMRLYTGWRRDNPNMIAGADHLVENLASNSRNGFDASGNQLNGRDAYYWYYATQVLFHMKGEYWAKWNAKLSPLLINGQVKTGPMAGSWDPYGPNPDRWAGLAGRLYVTSLNLLNLEVYYRHLPIYDDTAE